MGLARRIALAGLVALADASLTSCGGPTEVVDAPSAVASVAIDPPSSTIVVGGEAPLTATVQDASGQPATGVSIVWSVQDPAVASVSQTGKVTGRAVGTTQVAASVNGVSAVASITVKPAPVAAVALQPDTRALLVGQSAPLTATPKDASGNPLPDRAVTWASNATSVASVAPTGVVTAHAAGTATITATSEGVSATATVTVSPVPVGSVAIVPSTATVTAGQTVALAPLVKDANGLTVTDRVVTWSSSDDRIATVSAAGLVRGIAAGSATIYATSEGKSATAAVTVSAAAPQPAVSFVVVSPNLVFIRRGGTVQLSAAPYDANSNRIFGRAVSWSSDDQAVATVDANGLVTTKRAGTVLITATIDGKRDSSLITVTN